MIVSIKSEHHVTCEECKQAGLFKWPVTRNTLKEANEYARKHRKDHKEGNVPFMRGCY